MDNPDDESFDHTPSPINCNYVDLLTFDSDRNDNSSSSHLDFPQPFAKLNLENLPPELECISNSPPSTDENESLNFTLFRKKDRSPPVPDAAKADASNLPLVPNPAQENRADEVSGITPKLPLESKKDEPSLLPCITSIGEERRRSKPSLLLGKSTMFSLDSDPIQEKRKTEPPPMVSDDKKDGSVHADLPSVENQCLSSFNLSNALDKPSVKLYHPLLSEDKNAKGFKVIRVIPPSKKISQTTKNLNPLSPLIPTKKFYFIKSAGDGKPHIIMQKGNPGEQPPPTTLLNHHFDLKASKELTTSQISAPPLEIPQTKGASASGKHQQEGHEEPQLQRLKMKPQDASHCQAGSDGIDISDGSEREVQPHHRFIRDRTKILSVEPSLPPQANQDEAREILVETNKDVSTESLVETNKNVSREILAERNTTLDHRQSPTVKFRVKRAMKKQPVRNAGWKKAAKRVKINKKSSVGLSKTRLGATPDYEPISRSYLPSFIKEHLYMNHGGETVAENDDVHCLTSTQDVPPMMDFRNENSQSLNSHLPRVPPPPCLEATIQAPPSEKLSPRDDVPDLPSVICGSVLDVNLPSQEELDKLEESLKYFESSGLPPDELSLHLEDSSSSSSTTLTANEPLSRPDSISPSTMNSHDSSSVLDSCNVSESPSKDGRGGGVYLDQICSSLLELTKDLDIAILPDDILMEDQSSRSGHESPCNVEESASASTLQSEEVPLQNSDSRSETATLDEITVISSLETEISSDRELGEVPTNSTEPEVSGAKAKNDATPNSPDEEQSTVGPDGTDDPNSWVAPTDSVSRLNKKFKSFTPPVLQVLEFTLKHENFLSSVNISRLAKLISRPWKDVRDWFVARKLLKKKGTFLRNVPLTSCPYCKDFSPSSDEKPLVHLLSKEHVKNILGKEFKDGKTTGTPEKTKFLSAKGRKDKVRIQRKNSSVVEDKFRCPSTSSGNAKREKTKIAKTHLVNCLPQGEFFDHSSAEKLNIESSCIIQNVSRPKNALKADLFVPPTKSGRDYIRKDFAIGFHCPLCRLIFQTEWLLIKHSLSHRKFVCYECNEMFLTEHLLSKHLASHLYASINVPCYEMLCCPVCHSFACVCYSAPVVKPLPYQREFKNPQLARRSLPFRSQPGSGMNDSLRVTITDLLEKIGITQKNKTLSANPGKSPLKPAKPTQVSSLHQKKNLPVAQFDCSKCDTAFFTQEELDEHLFLHSVKSRKRSSVDENTSPDMPQEKVRRSLSQEKKQTKSKKSQFTCQVCAKRFNSQRVFKAHLSGSKCRSAPERNSSSTLACLNCGKSYHKEYHLRQHMRFLCQHTPYGTKKLLKRYNLFQLKERGHGGLFERKSDCTLPPASLKCSTNSSKRESHGGGSTACTCQAGKERNTRPVPDLSVEEDMEDSCTYCRITAPSKSTLKQHTVDFCPQIPSQLRMLFMSNLNETEGKTSARRLDQSGLDEEKFICMYCQNATDSKAALRRHMMASCRKIPSKVAHLFTIFHRNKLKATKGDVHLKRNLQVSFVKTKGGPRTYPSRKDRRITQNLSPPSVPVPDLAGEEHMEDTSCAYCHTSTPSKSMLKQHLIDVCPKIPSQLKMLLMSNLNQDAERRVSSKKLGPRKLVEEDFICVYCHVSTGSKMALKQHMMDSCHKIPNIIKRLLIVSCRRELKITTDEVHSKRNFEAFDMTNGMPSRMKCTYCNKIYDKTHVRDHLSITCLEAPLYVRDECEEMPTADLLKYFTEADSNDFVEAADQSYCIKVNHITSENASEREEFTSGDISELKDQITSVNLSELRDQVTPGNILESKDQITLENVPELRDHITSGSISKIEDQINSVNVSEMKDKLSSVEDLELSRCNLCQKRFSEPSQLLLHSVKHPLSTDFQCTTCSQQSLSFRNLVEHLLGHSGKTPYHCHFCSDKFSYSALLIKHLEIVHGFSNISQESSLKWVCTEDENYSLPSIMESPVKGVLTPKFEFSLESEIASSGSLDNIAELMTITDENYPQLTCEVADPNPGSADLPMFHSLEEDESLLSSAISDEKIPERDHPEGKFGPCVEETPAPPKELDLEPEDRGLSEEVNGILPRASQFSEDSMAVGLDAGGLSDETAEQLIEGCISIQDIINPDIQLRLLNNATPSEYVSGSFMNQALSTVEGPPTTDPPETSRPPSNENSDTGTRGNEDKSNCQPVTSLDEAMDQAQKGKTLLASCGQEGEEVLDGVENLDSFIETVELCDTHYGEEPL